MALDDFAKLLGPGDTLTDPEDTAPYLTDTRGRLTGSVAGVLRPRNVEQVQAILRHAHETRTPVIPQGGNTGLVGGSVPVFDEVVISTALMNNIEGGKRSIFK